MRSALLGASTALLVAAAIACPPPPKPPEPEPLDGGIEAGEADEDLDGALLYPDCKAACTTLKRLACPEALRFDGGSTCYRVCADAEKSGKFNLKPKCIAGAQTMADVRACGSVRCKE